LFVTLSR
jgi:hypothetical protein